MSYDGITEEENIRARLADLADGRILDDEPDDTKIPIGPDGRVRPYVVLSIGAPFRITTERSMADGEKDIPYTMTIAVGCFAGDRKTLNTLYKDVLDRLLDWSPNPGNALPLCVPYAYNGLRRPGAAVKPTIFVKQAAMSTTINLSTP